MKKRFESRTQLIWFFLKGSRRYFVGAVISALLLAGLDLVNPKIIGYTVDSVIGEEPSALPEALNALVDRIGGRAYLLSHLWVVAAAVIVTALLAGCCRYLFKLYNAKGAETLVKRMRDLLYGHILDLTYEWHGKHQTGDIIQRCTSDVETIKRFLSEQLTSLVRVIVLIVLALYFMAGINVPLMIASGVFIPIVILYSYFFHDKIGAAFQKVDTEEGKLSAITQENLTGVRVVRAFGREKYEKDRFEQENTVYTGMWVHLMKLLSAFWASNDLIGGLQILTVTAFGAYLCVNGSLTAGNFIAFISYNAMLTWPVRSLGRVISEMSKAGISAERILYIMNAEEEQDAAETQTTDYTGDIVFDNVTFAYRDVPVLTDVSLKIPGGATVGILGGTGSGKSTLVHLIDRLYSPEKGTISIGGKPLHTLKAHDVRSHVGLVLQEPYLFSRSLDANIRIGADGASHADAEAAARLACLDTAIEHFANGYDTPVGERGVTLSGGQKQRTAIAQTLIRQPEILIFDDSLSAVDAETDSRIRRQLAETGRDRTVILISHRLTTLMQADIIYVLDKGRIAEHGTHAELLAQNGIYRRISDLQTAQEA